MKKIISFILVSILSLSIVFAGSTNYSNWQPTNYTGCITWFDMADVNSMTLSGTGVSVEY